MSIKDKNAMMLIHDTSKTFKEIMRKKCEAEGISDRYRLILLFLGRNDGSTQLDIVNWTKLKAPTISLTLQMMEEDGLIKRVINENDKRNINIFLTETGRKMIDKIKVLIHETEDIMFKDIDKKDILLLEEVLRKMLSNVGGNDE